MPYTDFHYTPTGTGVISGKEVLEQTEDAINDLGGQISGDVQTAIDTANNALNTANTASADAQNAVNTANTAYTTATNAQNTANAAQNTASNALTAAQNAQNDVNALGNRVTTAEGNITQNTNAITGLTTRMGTAEGNITTLQNDVITAQGTATSAQNTATLARGQAYVVRYASVAVSDNSTVPYTDLNNVDNIKANDLLLDINGKFYQITSVDTSNETVSVTTPLTQLAVDSSVVHKSGNETISGDKTFANSKVIVGRNTDFVSVIQFVNSDVVGDSATGKSGFEVYGTSVSAANKIGGVTVGEYSNNGGSYAQIECNRTVSGVKSSNEIRNLIRTDGSKELSATIDNDCKLGSAFLRWSKIYGTEYYYGSNNVEFSTKFVTTDTNQTIGGGKTFTSNLSVYNASSANTPIIIGKSSVSVRDSTNTNGDNLRLSFYDKNNNTVSYIRQRKLTNGNTDISFIVYNTDANNQLIEAVLNFVLDSSNNPRLLPGGDNTVSLGVPTFKYRDINIYKINGLTPSSLSLPSNTGYIDISSYFTNTGDGQTNSYTASANGWIYLNVTAKTLIMQISDSNDNVVYADMCNRSSDGTIYMTILIGSGNKLLTQWFTSSSVTITTARFIPCQGNV